MYEACLIPADFVDWASNSFAELCLGLRMTPLISLFRANSYIMRKLFLYRVQWTNFQRYWTNFYIHELSNEKKFPKKLCYKFWFLRLGQIWYPAENAVLRQNNKNKAVWPWFSPSQKTTHLCGPIYETFPADFIFPFLSIYTLWKLWIVGMKTTWIDRTNT